jgi:hypothetical protein
MVWLKISRSRDALKRIAREIFTPLAGASGRVAWRAHDARA